MTRRVLIILRAALAGWGVLLLLGFLAERLSAAASDPEWLATIRLGLNLSAFCAAGWVTGRLSPKGSIAPVLLLAATLSIHDFNPLLPLDIPWVLHLAIDTIRDSRYADSFVTTAVSQVFLFGGLAAGWRLARPRAAPIKLLSSAFVHPIDMKLAIEGMHCDACVRRVQQAIVSVEGAKAPEVEVGSATVSVDPKREELVIEAVRKAGYSARKVE